MDMNEELFRKQREQIELHLSLYREKRGRVDELKIESEKLRAAMNVNESIEAATFGGARTMGMPRVTSLPDITSRIAMGLPDAIQLRLIEATRRDIEWQIQRMDTWISILPRRERFVISCFFVDGRTWPEITHAYNQEIGDGGRSEGAIRGFKRSGIERIRNYVYMDFDTQTAQN